MFIKNFVANVFAGAVSALMLGGCVTTHVQRPLSVGVPSEGTAVTVSITANTDAVNGLGQITLGRLSSGDAVSSLVLQQYILNQVAKDMAHDTTLFMGTLPPGKYYFSQLADAGKSNRYIKMGGGLGLFTVEEGKPVDLGRLIVTPLYGERVLVGRSVRVRDNRTLLERYSPEHLKLFAPEKTVSWSGSRSDTDRAEEVAMARPTGAECVTELPDGSVAAATRMGTVLWRSPEGTWKQLASDKIETLNCVQPVQMPDADLLAFGEFGTLLRHAPGQNKLEPIDTGNLPYGNLVGLAGNMDAGWYVAVQRNNEVTIYHSARLERGEWNQVRSEKLGKWLLNQDTWFWLRDIGTGFAYTSTKGTLHLYDYASGQWSERAMPDRRVDAMRISGSGMWSLITQGYGPFAITSRDAFVSVNQGQTWQEVTASHIPLVQRTDGTLLRFESSLMSDTTLHASSDMGKTWTLVDAKPKSRELTPLKSGAILGKIMRWSVPAQFEISNDGGKSWTAESMK